VRLFSRDVDRQELHETFQPRLYALLAGLLLLVAYVIAFVVENDKRVDVHFVLATAHTSLIWVIVLSLVIGLLAGLLLSQLYRRRSRKQLS
jgi:uncharacterized integral membrane protein